MEKLAFVRVADEDQIGEIEASMLAATEPQKEDLVQKLASEKCCECNPSNKHECKCNCHTENKTETKKEASAPLNKIAVMVDTLLVLSETLEDEGFEKLAAYSIVLADKLVFEAKAKKSKSKSKCKVRRKRLLKKLKQRQNLIRRKQRAQKKDRTGLMMFVLCQLLNAQASTKSFSSTYKMAPNAPASGDLAGDIMKALKSKYPNSTVAKVVAGGGQISVFFNGQPNQRA